MQETQAELEQSRAKLQETQIELEQLQATITAMYTSKFWKLRTFWFHVKELNFRSLFRLLNKVNFFVSPNPIYTKRILIEEISSPDPLVKHSATVDIIVCVHNAFYDVKQCLESVICYSSMPYNLILVDDGSQVETCKYLSDFANLQQAKLIRNEVARGYTFAANQGLKQSAADYAILLNSDTIVSPNWLDRMIACGESNSQIGIVGPLSNTASWQSIPELTYLGDWAENKLPQSMNVADMGRLVAKYSARLYPCIPFLNGFCLMIKRKVIQEIGYFDEVTFGAGYGEENDYCLRSRQAGWSLALADDAYVYHSQSRSYSHERRKLLCERADQALIGKYGQEIITNGVSVCRFNRVIEGIRARSRVMTIRQQLIADGKSQWEGKKVLIILPIREPGGGGNVVFQEAIAMQKMGIDVTIVNFSNNRAIFERSYPFIVPKKIWATTPIYAFVAKILGKMVASIRKLVQVGAIGNTISQRFPSLFEFSPDRINFPVIYVNDEKQISRLLLNYDAVIATLYKSVYWLETPTHQQKLPIRSYYIQDFEPYFFAKESEEYQTAWNSYTYYPDLVRLTKTEWNRNVVQENIGAECTLIGTSLNLDLYRPRPRKDIDWPQRPLKIAAMIRPSTPRRNPNLTMEVLQIIHNIYGDYVEINIFGCEPEDAAFLELPRNFLHCHYGILTQSKLAFFLNEIDIFVDFSTFQAMGLTAMEAMACGAAVIVPEKGGASSFAKHNENSLMVDTSSFNTCLDALKQLITDDQMRSRLQQQAIIDVCQYFPEKAAINTLNAIFAT